MRAINGLLSRQMQPGICHNGNLCATLAAVRRATCWIHLCFYLEQTKTFPFQRICSCPWKVEDTLAHPLPITRAVQWLQENCWGALPGWTLNHVSKSQINLHTMGMFGLCITELLHSLFSCRCFYAAQTPSLIGSGDIFCSQTTGGPFRLAIFVSYQDNERRKVIRMNCSLAENQPPHV